MTVRNIDGLASPDSLLGLAFYSSTIGKAVIAPEGSWLQVNDAFLDFFGCTRESISGLSPQQVIQLHDSEANLFEKVTGGILPSCRIEKRHIRKDGSVAWVDLVATLAHGRSGEPSCLVVEAFDMTQAMEQRRHRELFFDLSPDLLTIADKRGFIVEVCSAWTDLLGWSRSELTSTPYIQFVHPDDRERTIAQSNNILGPEPLRGFRNRYLHKNGSYRWLEWSAPRIMGDQIFCIARDVTQDFEAEEARKLHENKIRLLIENGSDAFIGMSQDGKITEWNQQAERMLGWSAQEVIGAEMSTLLAPVRYRDLHDKGIARFLSTGEAHILNKRVELPVLTKEDGELLVEMTVGAIKHGAEYYFATFMRDISHQKAMETQLHYQATRDYLTGLPNRYEFMSRLGMAIRREARTGEDQHVVLLFIDLDGFKAVNDRLGHDAGDGVLRTFADRLRHLVRDEIDTVARLAGDEFVILLENVSHDRAKEVASAVLVAGAGKFPKVGEESVLSASVGVVCHKQSESEEAVLSRADAAMYAAKQAGKGQAFFDSGDQQLSASGDITKDPCLPGTNTKGHNNSGNNSEDGCCHWPSRAP